MTSVVAQRWLFASMGASQMCGLSCSSHQGDWGMLCVRHKLCEVCRVR